jgi:hypothetical protein
VLARPSGSRKKAGDDDTWLSKLAAGIEPRPPPGIAKVSCLIPLRPIFSLKTACQHSIREDNKARFEDAP